MTRGRRGRQAGSGPLRVFTPTPAPVREHREQAPVDTPVLESGDSTLYTGATHHRQELCGYRLQSQQVALLWTKKEKNSKYLRCVCAAQKSVALIGIYCLGLGSYDNLTQSKV